jgi:hypothetical protein
MIILKDDMPACGGQVKGINLLSMLYHSNDITLPVGYVIVSKTETTIDADTGKGKRACLRRAGQSHFEERIFPSALRLLCEKYAFSLCF